MMGNGKSYSDDQNRFASLDPDTPLPSRDDLVRHYFGEEGVQKARERQAAFTYDLASSISTAAQSNPFEFPAGEAAATGKTFADYTPITSEHVFGRDITTSVASDGSVMYHADDMDFSPQEMDNYLGPSAAPTASNGTAAQEAVFLIGLRAKSYRAAVADKIATALKNSPPAIIPSAPPTYFGGGPPIVLTPTADECDQVAKIIAKQYVDAVQQALMSHPDATPSHGVQLRPVPDDPSDPVCANWMTIVNKAMNSNAFMTQNVQYGGKTVQLQNVISINAAQTAFGRHWYNGQPIQDNYNIVRVNGYAPVLGANDPKVAILDPWPTLLPLAYTTREHAVIPGVGGFMTNYHAWGHGLEYDK
jgi:hypothetical protein